MAQAMSVQQLAKIQRKMMELNPRLMAKVMAWNNMSLEHDIKENKKMQMKYIGLFKKAQRLV